MRQHLADWQRFESRGPGGTEHLSLRAQAEDLLARAEGDFERSRKLVRAGVESKEFKESEHWAQFGPLFRQAEILRHDGDNARAEEILLSALAPCESDEMLLYREMAFRPEHALNLAALGDLERAQAEISRCSKILAAGEDWRGLAGHFHSAAGYCSAAAGDQPESEQHFAAAIETFKRLSLSWSEADAFQLWGQALAATRQPRSAIEKFDAAIEIYQRIGAGQAWIERVQAKKTPTTKPTAVPPTLEKPRGEFDCLLRREGEYWTVEHGANVFRLRHSKGLSYLARLLASPGREFPALEMTQSVDAGSNEEEGAALDDDDEAATTEHSSRSGLEVRGDLGDAGALLDDAARAAYGRRLTELRDEMDEAREFKDDERAARAQEEIDSLAHQLKGAIGLAGRTRRAASSGERARIAVTQALRLALSKIAGNDVTLGKLLSTTIKTGAVCSYLPDDRFPLSWRL